LATSLAPLWFLASSLIPSSTPKATMHRGFVSLEPGPQSGVCGIVVAFVPHYCLGPVEYVSLSFSFLSPRQLFMNSSYEERARSCWLLQNFTLPLKIGYQFYQLFIKLFLTYEYNKVTSWVEF
jgi:hypothetical protein